MTVCIEEGCNQNLHTKNKCLYHYNRDYYLHNSSKILEQKRIYTKNNKLHKKEYDRNYRAANKTSILKAKYAYYNLKRKTDPCFKLRMSISHSIAKQLKSNSCSKESKSSILHLNYSIIDLKQHIEKQFEPWMTWTNHGKYNAHTWKDDDSSTWTWQLDHITPQSNLPYSSMEEENFKKCWSLENLRPLSAKQNIVDGASKSRHY